MRRRTRRDAPARRSPGAFQHRPFDGLAAPRRPGATAVPPAVARHLAADTAPPPPPPSDAALFLREVADVRPLPSVRRQRVAPPPPALERRTVTESDAEALAELSDLVKGAGQFDVTGSTEFIEGAAAGVDRRLVRRLRAGDFAYQAHLDLHGMTVDEARASVDRFLLRAYRNGHRCVLIVHGRGLNSKNQIPVLKVRLAGWLTRGTWARLVLALSSARPCDGGVGALYVLLRRQRRGGRKPPILVTHGAKW